MAAGPGRVHLHVGNPAVGGDPVKLEGCVWGCGARLTLLGRAQLRQRNSGSRAGQELEKYPTPIPATVLLTAQLLPPENKEVSLVWSYLGFINHDCGEQGPRHIILAVPGNAAGHRQQEEGSARCERQVIELTWGSAQKDVPEAHGSFKQESFQALHRNEGGGG